MLNLNIQPNGEDISIDSLEKYDDNQENIDQFLEDEIGSIDNLKDLEDNDDNNIKQNLKTKLESMLYRIKDTDDYYGIKVENTKYKIQKEILLENLEKIIQNQTNNELNQLEVQLELKQLQEQIKENTKNDEQIEENEYNIENGQYYNVLEGTSLESSLQKIIEEKNLVDEVSPKEMLRNMNRAWARPFASLFDNIDNEATLANMSTGFNLGLMKFINKLPEDEQESFLNQIYSGLDFANAKEGFFGTLDKTLAGFGLMSNMGGGAVNKTLKIQKLIEGISKAQNKYPNSNPKTNKYLHNPNEFANVVSDFLNSDQDSEYIENKISKEFGGDEIKINENDKINMKQIANSFDNTVRNDVILKAVQGVSTIPEVIDDTVGDLEKNLNGATNGFIKIFEKLERSSIFPEDITKSIRESMEKFIQMISEVMNGFAGYELIDVDQIEDEGVLVNTRINKGLNNYLENKDYGDSILKDFIIHDDLGISLDESESENLNIENKAIKTQGQLSKTVSQNINSIIENEEGNHKNTNEYFEHILENDDEFKKYIQDNYEDIQSQLEDNNNKLFKKDGESIVLNVDFLSLAIKEYKGFENKEKKENRGITKDHINFISEKEGFKKEAYKCPAGVRTYGYGFTKKPNGKSVKKGDSISRSKADNYLEQVIKNHQNYKNKINVKLTLSQDIALSSFEYNLGSGIWNKSGGKKIIDYINNGNLSAATNKIKKYIYADGKKLNGLANRRNAEAELLNA